MNIRPPSSTLRVEPKGDGALGLARGPHDSFYPWTLPEKQGPASNSATPQLRNTPPRVLRSCGVGRFPPKNRPLRSAPAEPDRSPPTPEPAHCRARLAKTMPPSQYRQDGTAKPVPPSQYRQDGAISASRCVPGSCRCALRLVGEIQVSRARECSGLVSTQQQSCFPKTRPPRTGNR